MLVVSCKQRNLGDVDPINQVVVSCKQCKVRDVEAGVFSTGMLTHIARVWINQVRLPVLHVIS